ncbi:hypothetical protein [Dyella sp.]|uniref:hypothetical protein n=1 Tax=Dyella sp. TaxID=1869338 RepID=UPI002ED32C26
MIWHVSSVVLLGSMLAFSPQASAVQTSAKHDSVPAESSTAPISIDRPLPPPAANDKTNNLTVEDFMRGLRAMRSGPDNIEQDPDYVNAIRGLGHIGENYANEIDKARKEGKKTDSCPPHGTATLTSDTLVPFLLRIPPEDRSTMSMDKAFHAYMREQFPCPGRA